MKKWEKKEKKDSEDFGGRRVKGSGNQWSAPGDVKSAKFLIDSKQTDKESFSITLKMWDKLYEEALFSFKYPMLSVQVKDKEFVVLSKEDFLHLLSNITT